MVQCIAGAYVGSRVAARQKSQFEMRDVFLVEDEALIGMMVLKWSNSTVALSPKSGASKKPRHWHRTRNLMLQFSINPAG